MPNYFLILSYDGTDFHGWQSQPEDRTVQDVLEDGLRALFAPGIRATAAGRTDAGVHAIALPVNFTSTFERPPETVIRALNSMLPPDVRVRSCKAVPDAFSARYDAVSRSYRYRLECSHFQDPLTRHYAWQLPVEMDWDSVQNAVSSLLGEHDFSSFRSAGCVAKSPVRKMLAANIENLGGGRFSLVFEANGFLRGMVRSIVGTLVEIGRGERPASDMAGLLASPDRGGAGTKAPPHGLYFLAARYPETP
jgi:tRNA pseudouridine38-40 synthase